MGLSLQGVPSVRHNVHNIASRGLRRRTACFKSALRTPQPQLSSQGLADQLERTGNNNEATQDACDENQAVYVEAEVQVDSPALAAGAGFPLSSGARRSVTPLLSAPPSPRSPTSQSNEDPQPGALQAFPVDVSVLNFTLSCREDVATDYHMARPSSTGSAGDSQGHSSARGSSQTACCSSNSRLSGEKISHTYEAAHVGERDVPYTGEQHDAAKRSHASFKHGPSSIADQTAQEVPKRELKQQHTEEVIGVLASSTLAPLPAQTSMPGCTVTRGSPQQPSLPVATVSPEKKATAPPPPPPPLPARASMAKHVPPPPPLPPAGHTSSLPATSRGLAARGEVQAGPAPTKKTVRLFWKKVPPTGDDLETKEGSVWSEVAHLPVRIHSHIKRMLCKLQVI